MRLRQFSSALLLLMTSLTLRADDPISETAPKKVNYPANFQVSEGIDLFVFGDYLYWVAQEEGLYYVTSGEIGSLKKIDPKFENGLRVGLGLNFPKAGYDLITSWTWFKTEAHAKTEGSLTPLWAEPDFVPFTNATAAKAHFDLDLNVFDLEWGRASWFGGHFSLRPFFGIRGAWINQSLHNQFTYATTPVTEGELRAKSNFKGAGLRSGADGRFTFPYGFAIYGLVSGSLLYGQFDSHATTQEDTLTIANTKDLFCQGTSALQMALGLGWDAHFAKDKCHVEFHLAWEQNIWFGINKMNHFINQLKNGLFFQEKENLSTQGLTVGGRFDF